MNAMNAIRTNARLFTTLHQRAICAFGAANVGEYVTEVAGSPWFAVRPGGTELVAEYHEAEDRYILKTFENEDLTDQGGEAGAVALWDALRDGAELRPLALHAVAQMWLKEAVRSHPDPADCTRRVRKLFGIGAAHGAHYALPKTLMVHELTQTTLEELKAARERDGGDGTTINRELSMLQTLLAYAQWLGASMPMPGRLDWVAAAK